MKTISLNEQIGDFFIEQYRNKDCFRCNAFLAFLLKVISAEHYYIGGLKKSAIDGYRLCEDELNALHFYLTCHAKIGNAEIPQNWLQEIVFALAEFLGQKEKDVQIDYIGVQTFNKQIKSNLDSLQDFAYFESLFNKNKSPKITLFSLLVLKHCCLMFNIIDVKRNIKLKIIAKEFMCLKKYLKELEEQEPTSLRVAKVYLNIIEYWKNGLELSLK